MICKCGWAMRRQEEPTKSGQRRVTHSCPQCYRFEVEIRSRSGLLVRWTQGVLNNAAPTSG